MNIIGKTDTVNKKVLYNTGIGVKRAFRLLICAIIPAVIMLIASVSAKASYAYYNYINSDTDYRRSCTYYAWEYARDRGYSFPDDWGNAHSWPQSAREDGYTVDGNPSIDSIACWSATAGLPWGHVAYVTEVGSDGGGDYIVIKEGGSAWVIGSADGSVKIIASSVYGVGSRKIYSWGQEWWPTSGFIHLTLKNPEVRGTYMETGYDRVLPDGDYLIAAAGVSDKKIFYYLDIQGTNQPAANDTNVAIYGPWTDDPPSYDIWSLTYNSSDKFYTIKQKGTNMCLDVFKGDTAQGTNVQVYGSNGGSPQKWAISRNNRNGYRLQAKCSGFSLDIADAAVNTSGTNVRQWSNNDSDAQSWLFIPYQPLQPIENKRAIILYQPNPSYELDVPGRYR